MICSFLHPSEKYANHKWEYRKSVAVRCCRLNCFKLSLLIKGHSFYFMLYIKMEINYKNKNGVKI